MGRGRLRTKAVCRCFLRLAVPTLIGLGLLTAGGSPLLADEFQTPAISAVHVEWRAVLDQLRSEINSRPSVAPSFAFSSRRSVPASDPRSLPALVQLNAVTSKIFTGIRRSPVPVLLPFDTAAFLDTGPKAVSPGFSPARYQADFGPADMFDAGLSGYDAVFSLLPGPVDGLPPRLFTKPVEVEITGSMLVYDINDPLGGKGEPVKALSTQFPDLRRFIREGYVRYAFTRFGVPYVVSIQCLDSVPRAQRLACREAYPIAERFLKALRIAGGEPSRARTDMSPEVAARPATESVDFTYRPSGDIIANSGFRKQGGRTDLTTYSQIRFPLENAPAFIHSQSFPKGDKSDQPDAGYPWRDNFCESRSFGVGQCPAGFGHQGEDIRPAASSPDGGDSRRSQPVVAVRDGILIRSPTRQAVTLQVNTANEHIRFRYMHMNPPSLDADGMLSGRRVQEGEKLGMVSNYLDHPNGTTRHLHFDIQVFTRDGWLWVNPYTTLVSAYERLIHGRGREIGPEIPAPSAVAHAMPEDVVRSGPQEGAEN